MNQIKNFLDVAYLRSDKNVVTIILSFLACVNTILVYMRFIVHKSQHLATSVKTAVTMPTSRYKRLYFDHEVKLKSPLPSRIVFFFENNLACSCGYTGVLKKCWLLNRFYKTCIYRVLLCTC